MNSRSIRNLYEEHSGLLSDKWSSYLKAYDDYFLPFRDEPINLLEIGVQNGGSLQIWEKYFRNSTSIIGIDNDLNCSSINFNSKKIFFLNQNALEKQTVEKVKEISGYLDIVIDDGSHVASDVISAFLIYFPLIRNGGVYIVEDVHTSYWKEFGGGLFNNQSQIHFFKKLADLINFENWGSQLSKLEFLSYVLRENSLQLKNVNIEILSQIESITFRNSLVIIYKGNSTLGKRIISGSLEHTTLGYKNFNNESLNVPFQEVNQIPVNEESLHLEQIGEIIELNRRIASLNEELRSSELLALEQMKRIEMLTKELSENLSLIEKLTNQISKFESSIFVKIARIMSKNIEKIRNYFSKNQ